jgi:hypothetical protein
MWRSNSREYSYDLAWNRITVQSGNATQTTAYNAPWALSDLPPQHTSLPLTPDAQSESTPRSDPAKSPLTLADDLEKIARDYQDGQQFGV